MLEVCLSWRYLSIKTESWIELWHVRYWTTGRPGLYTWPGRDPTQNFTLLNDSMLQYDANCLVVGDTICFKKGMFNVEVNVT